MLDRHPHQLRGGMRHHIVPNLPGPLIILMAPNVANNILLESSLTFLGLAIMLTVLGLNLPGDWLRDRLDPIGKV